MKRLGSLPITVMLITVAACAASPVADTYYSLVLEAEESATETRVDDTREVVIVGPVELPSYLNQRGLVIQLGDNRIQTASHNFWAEPLDEAIAKVLVRDLGTVPGGPKAERDAGRWNATTRCRLRFEFDRFHATNNSSVVASGRYWLLSDEAPLSRAFNLRRALTADGYTNAVAMLRQTLRELARDVAATLRDSPHCSKSSA